MLLKINLKLVSAIVVAAVIIIVGIYIFGFSGIFSHGTTQQLPQDVRYALEYFNAANSNSTIIVPSTYYSLAQEYSINGNKVIQNTTEYANILIRNATYPGINFVLIDMGQLNNLSGLYREAGLTLQYSVTEFPVNYTVENLTSGARNCVDFSNSTRAFAQCTLYVGDAKYGPISLVIFPGDSTLYTVRGAVFYSGNAFAKENRTYLPSSISTTNSTNFKNGIVFAYENVATFYLPAELMATFYGTQMFLPSPFATNIVDSYGEARVIKLG